MAKEFTIQYNKYQKNRWESRIVEFSTLGEAMEQAVKVLTKATFENPVPEVSVLSEKKQIFNVRTNEYSDGLKDFTFSEK